MVNLLKFHTITCFTTRRKCIPHPPYPVDEVFITQISNRITGGMVYTVIHVHAIVELLPALEQRTTCRHCIRQCTDICSVRGCPGHFVDERKPRRVVNRRSAGGRLRFLLMLLLLLISCLTAGGIDWWLTPQSLNTLASDRQDDTHAIVSAN